MSSEGAGTTPPVPPAGGTPDTATGATDESKGSRAQGTTSTRDRGQNNNAGATGFRISNFKGEVSDVGAVIGTKSKNRT